MTLEEVISECIERKLDFSLYWLDMGPEVSIEISMRGLDVFSRKAEIINVFKDMTNPYLTDDSLRFNADYEGGWQKVGGN